MYLYIRYKYVYVYYTIHDDEWEIFWELIREGWGAKDKFLEEIIRAATEHSKHYRYVGHRFRLLEHN